MFTVALIGPDGSGKTTICRHLKNGLPFRSKYIYMGINLEASNLVLPTTRVLLEIKRAMGRRPDAAGPPDPTRPRQRPKQLHRRLAASIKSGLRLLNQMGEEWFRQCIIWSYVRRGSVVLFDRHFFSDYYAYDIANNDKSRPWTSRIHGYMLDRWYPRPDLTILLEAPAEVMYERKGEGTVELLERRLQEYRNLRDVVPRFCTVDATQSEEAVTQEVADLIIDFYQDRKGKALEPVELTS